MANILGLALKVTGDASGLAKSLTPVDRALDNLGKQAEKATAVFQPFADKTAAAGRAQEEFAAKFETLAQQLRDGVVAPEQYAAAFGKLTEEAKASAAAFEEGLRVTREVRSEEERRAEELGRLQDLLERGAISQETFVRASERATGVEKERADAAASAARIIAANLTPQEKYDQQIQELTQHLDAGRLTQEQFNRAAQKAKSDLDGVGSEAAKTDKNIERLNNNVSILAKIEIGRLLFDGVRALGNAFTSVTSQISGLVGSVNSSVDTLNDFSARTGIGVEALQGYAVAAKLAGVDTEAFGASIQKLSVNIGKATPGDALDKSLRNINLSVQELRALSPEQQFSAIGQAISQLPTAADRAAAAVEVFGKQGAALAPLFREGADSIEELRARADRLGVIVNETQVENVASMNDGFDLVLATVQGIIGQVEGNLAPVVTAVTDEFLRFVENFASTEGTGGTGIANAITDVLLQGADYLAGVFDSFVASFTEWLSPLTTASTTFDAVTESLTAVTEILRGLFNGFQLVVNGLIIGMGKILEGLGAWVSTDLEAFGKGLADFGKQAAADNIKNINEAAGNAAQAVTNAFSGGNASPEAAGAGAAEDFVKGLKERIQRERAPEFQIATNIEKTRERFDVFFGGVVDQSSAVTDSMRGFEAAVAAVEDPLRMTEEEIARIKVAQDKVNEAINKELATRQEAADAAAKQADADAKRIEGLTKTNDAQSKLAEDIAAVEREQARVQEQQTAARNANDKSAADSAAARLAQLDQLQAKLQDTQAASEQGFSDGFTKAFDATGKSVSDLIAKTQDFGRVGAIAAEGLRNGVAAAQSQVRDGILTKESYDREVERQQDIFNQRLQGAQRVEQYLQSQLDERQRTELQYATQLEARKTEAIQNVQAIEDRIKAEEAEVESARERGDLRSAKAGTQRIRQLRQAAAIEKQISSARAPQQNGQFGGGGGLRNAAGFGRNITNAEAEQQQQVARSQRQALQSVNNALASVALANAEMARRAELSRPVQGTVQTADIRTAEGAALVLGLGATAQDPRLIEARLQTKQLGLIRQAIVGATAGYRNTPAEIF
jgi:hypothetical protein